MKGHLTFVFALLLVAMAFLPAAASAATVIQCVGTETIEFSPGLTLTPQATTIAVTLDLATCTGISDPPVTSLFLQVAPTFTASCVAPLDGLLITQTSVYTWNTGDTSSMQLTVTGTRAGAVQIITGIGEITGGLFEGASVAFVQTLPIPSVLQCLAPPGVTEISGPAMMTITLAELPSSQASHTRKGVGMEAGPFFVEQLLEQAGKGR